MRKDIVIKFLGVEIDENRDIREKFIIEIKDDNYIRVYKIPINGEIRIKNYLETGIEVDI